MRLATLLLASSLFASPAVATELAYSTSFQHDQVGFTAEINQDGFSSASIRYTHPRIELSPKSSLQYALRH